MRKLVLISALLLASASAHAGESRGLMLAANDMPAATDSAAPLPCRAGRPMRRHDAMRRSRKPTPRRPSLPLPSPPKRASGHGHESDEAKARRIAARYGVYW